MTIMFARSMDYFKVKRVKPSDPGHHTLGFPKVAEASEAGMIGMSAGQVILAVLLTVLLTVLLL